MWTVLQHSNIYGHSTKKKKGSHTLVSSMFGSFVILGGTSLHRSVQFWVRGSPMHFAPAGLRVLANFISNEHHGQASRIGNPTMRIGRDSYVR